MEEEILKNKVIKKVDELIKLKEKRNNINKKMR